MPRDESGTTAGAFELTDFFPYRLAILADRVSLAVSQVYADRYNLTRNEWRVLAALGDNRQMSAKDVGPYSTLDKMQVSRAVAGLEQAGYLMREDDAHDRRARILRLTAAGTALYQKLAPLVAARESYILEALDSDDRARLDRYMSDILARTEGLISRG
jgi:DNA-binding MarR family transcriptional regulator